ncbi:hypothetical protein ACW4TU_41205 [Streptomyces sp. QTS52]
MDAGLAALLGALAGAVSATAAGVSTGWATREQAKISARAEHYRQRIEPREAAYRAFITANNALVEHMGRKYGFPSDSAYLSSAPSREFAGEGRELAKTIRNCWQDIALLGPPAVAEAATSAEAEAFQLASQCLMHALSETFEVSAEKMTHTANRAHTRYNNLKQSIITFTSAAQQALDSDGIS